MDLYLTRHGETVWNTEYRMQGRENSPLTEKGIEGARTLSRELVNIPIQKCFVSPMPRAVHTAHLLLGTRAIPFEFSNELAEMNLGDWEGVTFESASAKNPEACIHFRQHPESFVARPGGESFTEVIARAEAFLKSVERMEDRDGPIMGVTHCILLQAITLICDGRDISTLRTGQRVDQTKLFHLRYENGKWTILMRNGEGV
ncbi:MAG TPA: histidine phosphatase family protein [Bacillota bacterium]|nr:histidine phosphatase family protein [Bacillota bacterium]HPE38499.1 histidine phosphatase family protein [Bacillota bacterium]